MGLFSSFFHPERAYEKAGQEQEKYYGQAQGYLQPYINQGQNAYSSLMTAQNALMNPQQLHNQWAEGYEQSPYARMLMEDAQNQGLEAASSQGLFGSTPAIRSIQAGASRISAADRENYLNNLMQKYIQGAGIAQNIYGTGAQAGGQLANNAMSMGQQSAENAYNKAAAPGQMFGNLLGLGSSLGAAYLTGGASLAGQGLGGAGGTGTGGYQSPPWRTGGIQ